MEFNCVVRLAIVWNCAREIARVWLASSRDLRHFLVPAQVAKVGDRRGPDPIRSRIEANRAGRHDFEVPIAGAGPDQLLG